MAAPLITLWSDAPAAAGAQLLDVVDGLDPQESEIERWFNETGHLQFVVARDARWLSKVELLHVLHVRNPLGAEYDFRVRKIYRGRGPGRNRFVVAAEPIAEILGDDVIMETTVGGESTLLLGGSYTPEGWVTQKWLPRLYAAGKTWIDAGTFDFQQEVPLAAAVRTTLSGIREIEKATQGEFQFERLSSGLYRIHILSRVGTGAKRIVLSVERQLEALDMEEGGDQLATEVVPLGAVPDGGIEAATIGRSAWRVTAVDSGTGDLTLEAPRGGDGPFLMDGQFAESGREGYVLAQDATLHQVLATTAPDTVRVGSPGSFAVGDHVEIRADAAGTLTTGLRDPTAAKTLQRTWPTTEYRGERNYLPNPAGAEGVFTADSMSGRAVSYTPNAPNTDVTAKELRNSASLASGDVFVKWSGAGWWIGTLVGPATVDGSGNVTVTVTGSFTVALNDEVQIYRSGTLPTGWTRVGHQIWHPIALIQGGGSSAGAANGSQTSVRRLAVSGLGPDEPFYTGYQVDVNGTTCWLLSRGVADGAGDAELELDTRVTVTDGDPVFILAPDLESEIGAGMGLVVPLWKGNLTAGLASIDAPLYTIRADPVENRLWYRAGLAYLGTGDLAAFTGSPGGPYSKSPAKLQLIEAGVPPAVLDGFDDSPRTLDPGGVTEISLSDQFTLAATRRLAVRLTGVLDEQPNLWRPGPPFTVARWAMEHLGPDGTAPPVDGSHATPLWQLGNGVLDSNGPATGTVFEVYGQNLALDARYVTVDETPTLGADVRIYDEQLGVNKDARLLGHRWWPGRDARMQLIVDTRPLELTKLLEEG